MSGPIVSGSPWGRAAIASMDPEDRAQVERAIPDGSKVIVTASRKPGDWTLILRDYAGEVRRVHSRSIEVGCERLLASEVVVEDHGAFVVTAEVAS